MYETSCEGEPKLWMISKVDRFLLLHQKLKSSANRFAFIGIVINLVMSLMPSRNSVTESDDPWGMPLSWENVSESVFDVFTNNFLDVRKFDIYFSMFNYCAYLHW